MTEYSSYFTTIYDEKAPTGHLGRGIHYSVLRALSWHPPFSILPARPSHYDFAIIWDEDHDERVINCVEEIYMNGLLSKFIMFGERKGFFTAIVSPHCYAAENDSELKENIEWIAQRAPAGDVWTGEIVTLDSNANTIISDVKDKVTLYLKNIEMLWQLGGKPIPTIGENDDTIPHPAKFIVK